MKNFLSFSKLFLALAVIFFASSCGTDDTLGPVTGTVSPSIFLESGPDLLTEATTIDPGTIFNVRLSATAGDNEMNSLTVRQDGDILSTDRFDINGVPASNNPTLLFESDRSTFVYDLAITPHESGTSLYEFVVAGDDVTDDSVTSLEVSITDGVLTFSILGPTSIDVSTDPSLINFDVNASSGASPLNTIAVLENGVVITDDLSRLRYGDVGVEFDSNPFFLPEDDKSSFAKRIYIRTQPTSGVYNYDVILEDESGVTETVTYVVNVLAETTDLTQEFLNKELFNNAGAGFGTLNLEIGVNESSINNATAQIKDIGNESGVWAQRIEPINGAVLRILSSASFYTYDNITSRETLIAAWDESATDLPLSGVINPGSSYMVRNGAADYYVFTCISVEASGGADNQKYTFNIKKSQL